MPTLPMSRETHAAPLQYDPASQVTDAGEVQAPAPLHVEAVLYASSEVQAAAEQLFDDPG
jgi:hypothetical protein